MDRVTPTGAPFQIIGVDCFGPFLVKRGRSREKRYGCLFTCMTTRAIHVEVLYSLDTSAFINALVRFMSRRGVPSRIRSDNGTNFIGAERELQEAVQHWNRDHKLVTELHLKDIEWVHNPPAASHMGGVWERMIRSVRKILNVLLRDQVLDDERLNTVFCEVESVVNGRPITSASGGPLDLEPLTPNHLLLLRAGPQMPLGDFHACDTYSKRWKHVQHIADYFWKRWLGEYLPTLHHRQKWIKNKDNLHVGDIVLVCDTAVPRKSWPLGRIMETFPQRDGLVRSAKVKTSQAVLTRPVVKLCRLEVV